MSFNLPKFFGQFWWARGVVSALAILALFEKYTVLDRLHILAPIHAVLTQWNHVAAWLGTIIGKLPYVPELEDTTINVIILFLVFVVPSVTPLATETVEDVLTAPDGKVLAVRSGTKQITIFLALGFLTLQNLLIEANSIKDGTGYGATNLLSDPSVFAHALGFFQLLLLIFGLSFLAYHFVVFCRLYPSYLRGFLHVGLFLLTLEMLYLLNLPWLGDRLNAYTCAQLDPRPDHCVPDGGE